MTLAITLIATDLDGTLLRSDGTVSNRTCRAIQRARRRGIQIVLVTARPPRSIPKIAERLDVGGFAICSNGAIIYDIGQAAIIKNERLATELILSLGAALQKEDAAFSFATEHGHKIGYEPGYPLNNGFTHLVPPQVAALRELCSEAVTKLIVHHPDLAVDMLLARVNTHLDGKAAATHSGQAFVEISAAGVSKASGLAILCRHLGVAPLQVIAFGDMPNDLPMLAFAGRGVAMGNAHPEVLRMASEVTGTHDQDGVAQVLERLLPA